MFFWVGIGGLVLVCVYGFRKWDGRPVDWAPEEVMKLLDSWVNDDVTTRLGTTLRLVKSLIQGWRLSGCEQLKPHG